MPTTEEPRCRNQGTLPVDHPPDKHDLVIGKLIRRRRDKDGRYWACVKWYGYPAMDVTWETEDALPCRLLARLAKSRSGDLVDLG